MRWKNKVPFDSLPSWQHSCQKLLKSVDACQSYSKPKQCRFFETQCSSIFIHSLEQYTCVSAECANAYGDDEMCTYWAITGECVTNTDFMMKYCHKACSRCDADSTGMQSNCRLFLFFYLYGICNCCLFIPAEYFWKRTHSALDRSPFKSLRNQYHNRILAYKTILL